MSDPNPLRMRDKLLSKISGESSKGMGAMAPAGTILKNLDSQYGSKYLLKLDEARKILSEYLEEVQSVESRLNKVESPSSRRFLGERDLIAKRRALKETLRKLEAHQEATIDRLFE